MEASTTGTNKIVFDTMVNACMIDAQFKEWIFFGVCAWGNVFEIWICRKGVTELQRTVAKRAENEFMIVPFANQHKYKFDTSLRTNYSFREQLWRHVFKFFWLFAQKSKLLKILKLWGGHINPNCAAEQNLCTILIWIDEIYVTLSTTFHDTILIFFFLHTDQNH